MEHCILEYVGWLAAIREEQSMIYIKYERYWNDYIRKIENKAFAGLNDLANWIFGQMQRDYSEPFAMSFPTPERLKCTGRTGPYRIKFVPERGGESIWIHLIKNENGIIFSDGKFTSGQEHWSSAVRDWCIACDKRQHSPEFNFVE